MKIPILSSILIFILSCNVSHDKRLIELRIEGMSCEYSCAPFIEKNILKSEGVLGAFVSFQNESAEITFESNSIDKSQIIENIQSLADGAYKVSILKESKIDADSKKSFHSKKSKSKVFEISESDISNPKTFQLPNLFNLLNSILN
jgi:copper chaperone CopZ